MRMILCIEKVSKKIFHRAGENIQFNNIALASMGENYSQVYSLYNAGIMEETWFNEFDEKHYCLENKLIKMNKGQIEKLGKNDWKDDYVIHEQGSEKEV